MAEAPIVQIIEKEKYFNQHLISLPDERSASSSPLTAPSSLRLRTRVLSLTANNLTYVKLGFLLGWWDVHPLPPSTPAPYNDADAYGRTNCWGFAEVLESTVESVPRGSYLFGYHPIGTLAQDLTVREAGLPGHVVVTNEYRKDIMPIYNRYIVQPAAARLREQIENRSDAVALDAVVRVMFETAYLINRFVLAEDSDLAVHPSPDPSTKWEKEDTDLADATLIVLAPGSKVGLAFAYDVRHGRKVAKPKRVIGAASDASKKFVEGTQLYDQVVSTSGSLVDILSEQQVAKDDKIVILDFGGRGGVLSRWGPEVQSSFGRLTVLGIGSDIQGGSRADVMESMKSGFTGRVQVNADDMRARAIGKVGEKKYFEGLETEWRSLRDTGVKGLKLNWGEGMQDVEKGWDKLCHGEVAPDEGLVFSI